MSETIVTIASVPAILAIVNLLKSTGIDGKLSAVLAVVIGAVLSVLQYRLGDYVWFQEAMRGVILGLGAAGVYDLKPSETKEE